MVICEAITHVFIVSYFSGYFRFGLGCRCWEPMVWHVVVEMIALKHHSGFSSSKPSSVSAGGQYEGGSGTLSYQEPRRRRRGQRRLKNERIFRLRISR